MSLIQIRLHGRGGQGVVTAAELIAIAGFSAGHFSQAFPFFGVERSGAPIQAFARLSDEPIKIREHVYDPDILIIQDDTLLSLPDIFSGAHKDTKIIVNTSLTPTETAEKIKLEMKNGGSKKFKPITKNIYTVDATKIALDILGKNIVNTVILGKLVKATDLITLEGLKEAITKKFIDKGKDIITKNILAVETAYKI